MRAAYQKDLSKLHEELIKMGSICEEAIRDSVDALKEGNESKAKAAIPLEQETDQLERSIESRCMRMLWQQQPVAGDFRNITAAMRMITDLERIGDQATDIARIVISLEGRSVKPCMPLISMAEEAMAMVNLSIDAFVKQDVCLAKGVIEKDSLVDANFERVKDYLIELIANNPDEGEFALNLLMIAKYLERIGDHATNIAEWVIYSVTGAQKERRNDLVR